MRPRYPKACKSELTANKTNDIADYNTQKTEEHGNGVTLGRNLLNLLVDSLCFDGHTYYFSIIAALSRASVSGA